MTKDSQIVRTLAITFLLLFAIELGLQVRSEIKTGNSIFTALFGAADSSTQMFVQHDGYRTLNVNTQLKGADISIHSNSLGLRSSEISVKSQSDVRVIVLGASTVYGAYAPTNQDTFPSKLQQLSSLPLDVINAGIPGNSIRNQYQLYRQHLNGLSEDILLLYPGLNNDISAICQREPSKQSYSFAQLTAPKWLMTTDLLLKNSTGLRYVPYKVSEISDISDHLRRYAKSLEQIVELALARQVKHILLVENVKAFREEQPLALQQQLANTALYYSSCLSVEKYNKVFAQFNQQLFLLSTRYPSVSFISMQNRFPGGRDFFTDSVHFTDKGEQLMATLLDFEIQQRFKVAK